jgi:hypothetical protein
MKTINILKGNLNNPDILETLKCSLDKVGIKAFTIDFETNVITLMTSNNLIDNEVNCAFLKAGLHCACNETCKTSQTKQY